jgi:NADPH:quinone reductase-like Zn-dependent oxidoreductase
MKAIIWMKYGAPDGLQLREVATPQPKEHEVLIKVHAATVSTPDTEFRRLKLPLPFAVPLRLCLGLIKPTRITILGTEFAGEIAEAGREVTRYKAGDQVFGYTGLGMGAYAEYLCLPENPTALASMMAMKPANVPYEEACALSFGAIEALQALRKANVQKGQKVLIVGAGGNIGTYAVQLARHYGAEVTGVDKAGKLEMLRSIGSDHVIDYTREDFTKCGQVFDVILDTIGKSPFEKSLRLLTNTGAYINANPGLLGGIRMRLASKNTRKRIIPWSAEYTNENLLAVKELVEAGTIRAIIDRHYRMEQIVEAHRYVETGQKKGNVVIIMTP